MSKSKGKTTETDSNAKGVNTGVRQGGRGHSSRSHGWSYRSSRTGSSSLQRKKSNFRGNTEGMNGNIFQCHLEKTDKKQFLKILGVLEELINKTFEYPEDVASICVD